jgi:TonB family protein
MESATFACYKCFMPSPGLLAQAFLCSLLLISFAQQPPQDTPAVSRTRRFQLKQEHLCCLLVKGVDPIYPRESRLARTEGVVRLVIVIAKNGSVADVQSVSGDPPLLDAAITAVRQWRTQEVYLNGQVVEAEVPLTFTFTIQDPPNPAYLHLTNGKVIRANELREYTDTMEYTVGRHTHHVSPHSVTKITACLRNCIYGGGPSFNIVAIPLLPAKNTARQPPR